MEERFPSSRISKCMFTTEIVVRQIIHGQFFNCIVIAMTFRLDLGADVDYFVVVGGGPVAGVTRLATSALTGSEFKSPLNTE